MTPEQREHAKELLAQAVDLLPKVRLAVVALTDAIDSNLLSAAAEQQITSLIEACLLLQGSESAEHFYS